MKRIVSMFFSVLLIAMAFGGCGKSNEEYQAAISKHMRDAHDAVIQSYRNFETKNNSGAFAEVEVMAETEFGAEIILSCEIYLNSDAEVTSCSWC